MTQQPDEAEFSAAVLRAVRAVAPKNGRAASPATRLTGSGAALDSVEFINLLVCLEEELGGKVDLSQSYLESGAEDGGPFATVGDLGRHIGRLLAGEGG
jgi:acyl carrier protein